MVTTAVIILLLTLMGAGVGFTVGVFLKPNDTAPEASAGADPTKDVAQSEAPSGEQAAHASGAEGDHAAKAHDGNQEEDGEPPEMAAGDEDPPSADLAVVPFPPVLTVLANPKEKWIRLEGSVLVRANAATPAEQLGQRAGQQILSYLKTVDLAQIEGPSGFLALRHDLNETVRTLSDGEVRGVLIHGLIVE